MDAYAALVRPVAFSLSPETAHRAAGLLLRMPIPWPWLGGAVDHPALRTTLAGVALRNPIGLAAGFDKSCRTLEALGLLGFGYVVGGTVTRSPRTGNAPPRIVRVPGRASMVNAMGLPNRGAAYAAARLAEQRPTCARFVSLADEAEDDVVANHALLEPLVDGFELNASCPNVSWGRDRDTESHLRALMRRLGERRSKPLFVKLPPFRTARERDAVLALARVAGERGVDGLTCSNTRPVAHGGLSTGRGGLSGRALFADTPRMVHEVRDATGGRLPVNACGGISTAEDAVQCLEAGATTVQLYTGLVYRGPRILREMTTGLATARRRVRTAPEAAVG
jgi:dihydroorotate dehydrogenase